MSQEPNKKKQAVAAKNGKVAAPTKKVEAESSDSSDSDDTESDVSVEWLLYLVDAFVF